MRKTQPTDYARDASPGGGDDSKYNTFVHAVWLAVLLGAGGIIWFLVNSNATLDKRITLLEYKCMLPSIRGVP